MTQTEAAAEPVARVRPLVATALFALSLGSAALVLLSIAPATEHRVRFAVTLALAAAFFIAEGLTVHIPARRDSHTISLVEIPLVVALAFAIPAELLVARLIGSGAALVVVRRQLNPLKLGFNLGAFAVETMAAVVVFYSVAGSAAPTDLIVWIGVGAALITFQTVGALAVSGAIWINDARPSLSSFRANYLIGMVGTTMAWAWGLVTISVIEAAPLAAVPAIALAAGLYWLLAVFGRLRRRHEDLKIVHTFTTALDAVDVADELPRFFLAVINDHFMTSTSMMISETENGSAVLVLDSERGAPTIAPAASGVVGKLLEVSGSEPVMLDTEAIAAVAKWTGFELRQGAAVPIPARRAVLLLGNPRPSHSIGDAELSLLQTLGAHAGSVFERHRLFGALADEVELRQHQALHDGLTDLPNRSKFLEHVDQMLETPEDETEVAVVLLDLDDFKAINDTLSHRAGDRVLVDVAARLVEVIRSADIVARVGGDEFAVAIRVAAVADAFAISKQIKKGLHQPFVSAGVRVEVGASIGIALGADSAITLLRQADIAMYAAKRTERRIEIYRDEIDDYDADRLELAGELRHAIEAGQVEVHYQPKVRVVDGSIAGFEALARWAHPSRGTLPPIDFIPIADRTGLMLPLTKHVLETALMDAATWADRGWSVSVNFSPRTLATSSPDQMVSAALARTGVAADRLIVEVTETAILPNKPGSGTAIDHLHELGVAISIDDFGTGYSSMGRLGDLPITELKIDRSFISTFETDSGSRAIVETTVALARRLGLKTVAEGVEEESTVDELRALGVDEIQGYHYSRALPIGELRQWVAEHERRNRLRAVG